MEDGLGCESAVLVKPCLCYLKIKKIYYIKKMNHQLLMILTVLVYFMTKDYTGTGISVGNSI